MNTDDKPTTKKAHPDPAKEALSHPNGPSLLEMIDGKEDQAPKKNKETDTGEPENGPIPVI